MVKKKGKITNVQTRKRKGSFPQRAIVPIVEDPLELMDNINRMFSKDPWIKPLWNHLIMNQVSELHSENKTKFIPVDMIDSGKEYQIVTELPGVNKKDIEITLTPTMISICGAIDTTIQKESSGYVKRERGYSTLCRYLRFPEDINPDNAEAILSDGILQINIAKKIPLKKKRISVKYQSKK
jgi:HSP20 family protein